MRRRFSRGMCLAVLTAAGWLLAGPASAQEQPASAPASAAAASQPATQPASQPAVPSESPTTELNVERLQQTIKDLEASTSPDGQRAEILKLNREALAELTRARELTAKLQDYRERAARAPDDLAQIQAKLDAPPAEPEPEIGPDTPLSTAQQKLAEAEAQWREAQRARDDAARIIQERDERRLLIPNLITQAQQRLEEAAQVAPAAPDEPVALIEAKRTLAMARQATLRQEMATLEAELTFFDARAEVSRAARDLTARDANQAEKLFKARQAIVQELQRVQVEQAAQGARAARAKAALAAKPVKALLDQNASLAEERASIAQQREQATRQAEEMNATLQRVKDEYKRVREVVQSLGADAETGRSLRKARLSLPSVREHRVAIRQRESQMARMLFRNIELSAMDARLVGFDDELAEIKSQLDPSLSADEQAEILAQATEQLQAQKRYTSDLTDEYQRYLTPLGTLDSKERALVEVTEAYAKFIDENVLATQSSPPLSLADFDRAARGVVQLLSPARLAVLAGALWTQAWAYPSGALAALAGFLLLLGIQPALLRRLRDLSALVNKPASDQFRHTLRAGFITLLLVAPGPLLLSILGWTLLSEPTSDELLVGAAVGLLRAAFVWSMLGFLWQLCRPAGLGEAHFRWRVRNLRLIRRNLAWFIALVVPCGFFIAASEASGQEQLINSLGRLTFIAFSLALAVFAQRVLRPSGGALEELMKRNPNGWIHRLRLLWYPLVVGAPVFFALLAAAGYFYTALQLEQRLLRTVLVLLAVMLLNAVTLRWLFVAQRKMVIAQAAKRRVAEAAERATREDSEGDGQAAVAIEEPQANVLSLSAQARQLIQAGTYVALFLGAWLVWRDTIPAFSFLNNVKLWEAAHAATPSAAAAPAADGAAPAAASAVVDGAMTLADLLLALFIMAVTILLGKNLPGLLEISLLTRLPLEPAARYAITTLARYVITITGLLLAFGAIGVGWSKVQWLAAAITFGLGFGLQEIFANFISGIILLFERPIRLGDVVTVGGVSGTVTRMRIRATTITDADRKELIIPNKELIVGRVVNWTLSDRSLRLVFPVAVAHGSDIALVTRLLLRVAEGHPHVSKDLKPEAAFLAFGDNALSFELRVIADDLANGGTMRHELNAAIEAALRQAGIELALPQRDLHVRSVDAKILQALQPPSEAESSRQGISESKRPR